MDYDRIANLRLLVSRLEVADVRDVSNLQTVLSLALREIAAELERARRYQQQP